ncbi:uncharacterized protein LOC127793959 isoform X2 [Diospyros lotus]|uniref:uncharacterized protein LOC127793959 isoform X2 n=1 Tax=Diospyros lotus TaxID=55363 RepID=UPI0022589F89|nr:uncharacterized protein LOC127793959 isoform X2 [Diospyros lotus]
MPLLLAEGSAPATAPVHRSEKAMASRYSSFDSRSSTQSHQSDPSSSTDLKPKSSFLKRFTGGSTARRNQSPALVERNSSRAIVKANSASDLAAAAGQVKKMRNDQNLSAMVKKFMAAKPKKKPTNLVIAADILAEDLKKTTRKGSDFSGLNRKLFSEGGSKSKALTEVKSNTRTLAMVLRSERELLNQNKDLELEIAELKSILEQKNGEVEKLKDLCLKQREEIKSLKSAVLFPDETHPQVQEVLEKQGSELKQAKQLIPNLQRQVTSLTGQLEFLARDLAEVKAAGRGYNDAHLNSPSPKSPAYVQEHSANSLEFSYEENTPPGSPGDMFLKDLNPCLTPYNNTKAKSAEFEGMGYNHSPQEDESFW